MSCRIQLPDGNFKEFSTCPTALSLAKSISSSLAKKAVGFLLDKNPNVQDIRLNLKNGDKVEIVTIPCEKSLQVIRHSSAHVLAQATQNLWPEVKVTIGPVIQDGFYYDFDTDKKFTPQDLNKIEQEMKSILKQKYKLTREIWTKQQACIYFEKKGELLKKEIIENLNENQVSIYKQGPWLDLCRGPHVQHLGQIGAVKVLSQSGAYWRGDSSKKQLQRIYGTAFHTEKQLQDFLKKRELAQQHDHRQIGKKLKLFWFSELCSGSPFFTPKGTAIYRRLQEFLQQKYREYDYQEVISPQVFSAKLFYQSGHAKHFYENMYTVLEEEDRALTTKGESAPLPQAPTALTKQTEWAPSPKASTTTNLVKKEKSDPVSQNTIATDLKKSNKLADTQNFTNVNLKDKARADLLKKHFLKPMNCPGHCLLYKKDRRSYRDLPWRVADFGRLHRREPAGALQGLTRVKSFCQDDAHIFCRLDQLSHEIQTGVRMLEDVYQTFGLNNYKVALSTRPKNRMGQEALWDQAEQALSLALKALKIPYELQPGEGAFYGPKLDISVRDAFDRSWQLGTFQCDFNLPRAFNLSYINKKDEEERPVIIHRAILGSLERFMGVYLEHTKGRLPTWLCPVQAIILPLTDREHDFSTQIKKTLEQQKIICKIDKRNEKLSYKILFAQNQQIPYMLIVGQKELNLQKVSVRLRTGELFSDLDLSDFAGSLSQEIRNRMFSSFFLKNQGR